MYGRRDGIGESLRRSVANGLHLGRLHAGDRLGSARQTAREVGSDYRTVVGALRALERDGLVEIRPRGGVYVGCGGRRPAALWTRATDDRLVDLVVEEVDGGAPLPVVAERLRRCLDTRGLRAACLECNTDQLDFLCDELRTGFGLATDAIEVSRLRRALPLAVRQADLLVSTTFHAGEVRRCAAVLGKPYVLATLDPRRRAELIAALEAGPVYFVATDPRWAAKALVVWGEEPGAERLHAVTLGHDSLAAIPAAAALLPMPRARPLLAGTELASRALPYRGFSNETRRAILSFVVRANAARATRQLH